MSRCQPKTRKKEAERDRGNEKEGADPSPLRGSDHEDQTKAAQRNQGENSSFSTLEKIC